MNFAVHLTIPASAASDAHAYVPPQVEQLAWRERQVAAIVYRFGYATAKDVELELGGSVSNGAIRSMLVRLTRKGLLRRRRGKRGAGCADVFIAALSIDHARRRALAKLADEFFGGSYSELQCFVTTSLAHEHERPARSFSRAHGVRASDDCGR